jgi:Protein of unknown function (DUF642)/PEP-CTERM motif
MRHFTHAVWAACALILAAGGQARGDLVVNGGFETGNYSGWAQSGSFSVVTGGPGHVGAYIGGYGPNSGNYYAALGTVRVPGTLSQTLTTTPGQSYTLSFFLASDGGTPNEFRVDWNGVTIFDQSNIAKQGYTKYSFQVQAGGTATPLAFLERNDPGYLSLDDVSVPSIGGAGGQGGSGGSAPSTAPEPSSLMLLGFGALGLAGYARVRRRWFALRS